VTMKHGLARLTGAGAALALLASVAVAGPPGHPVRVGILEAIAPAFDPDHNAGHRALVEGLKELGYAPGRDIVFKYKSAEGDPEAVGRLAEELVASGVDILVTPRSRPPLVAARVTKTVPIIMVGTPDPVDTGLAKSLARPGGNVTGLSSNSGEPSAKRMQLLQEAVPGLSRVAVLWNASLKSMAIGFENIEQASPKLGVTVQSVRLTSSDEFDKAFAAIENGHPDGLIVLFGPLRGDDLPRIVDFVVRQRLPSMFEQGQGVRGGGLMEFGPNLEPMFRRAAIYIDKIANGADPATLPIEEPTGFEFAINLKAAKSIGIEIPQSLLLRADRVVE
jgi:putative tryptophan/tyrosine transport system substrate-binding protein